MTGFAVGSIYDQLGLPPLVTNLGGISALFNRAADLCWNEWCRDENIQNSLTIQKGDGPDDPAQYEMRFRNKRKDYFTSALPWPQKGDAITVNIGGTAPVNSVLPPLNVTGLSVRNVPGAAFTGRQSDGTTVTPPYAWLTSSNDIQIASNTNGAGALPNLKTAATGISYIPGGLSADLS